MATCSQLARCSCRGLCLLQQGRLSCSANIVSEPISTFVYVHDTKLSMQPSSLWCRTHELSFPVCICSLLASGPVWEYHALTQIHVTLVISWRETGSFRPYNTAAQPQIMCFVNVLPYCTAGHSNRLMLLAKCTLPHVVCQPHTSCTTPVLAQLDHICQCSVAIRSDQQF